MTPRKTFRFTVATQGTVYTEEIQAINRTEAKRLAEARYPGSKLYGFNSVG